MWTTGFQKGPHRRCFKASSGRRLAADPTGFVTPRLPARFLAISRSGDAHRHVRLWAGAHVGDSSLRFNEFLRRGMNYSQPAGRPSGNEPLAPIAHACYAASSSRPS